MIRYNAAIVPILDLGLSSDTLSEQEEYDLGYNFMRTQLANIAGRELSRCPTAGKPQQIMVDINPQALYSHGLSASDVSDALNTQSLILPTGSAKIGTREYRVELNNSPTHGGRVQQSADQDHERHHHLSCATSRRFATAPRCRPTSCATTDGAARC